MSLQLHTKGVYPIAPRFACQQEVDADRGFVKGLQTVFSAERNSFASRRANSGRVRADHPLCSDKEAKGYAGCL